MVLLAVHWLDTGIGAGGTIITDCGGVNGERGRLYEGGVCDFPMWKCKTHKISKKKIDNIIRESYKDSIMSMQVVKWTDTVTSMIICNPFNQTDNYFSSPMTDDNFAIFDNWCGDIDSYITRNKITTTTWGRTDRNDPMDIEAAYEIPMSLFRITD